MQKLTSFQVLGGRLKRRRFSLPTALARPTQIRFQQRPRATQRSLQDHDPSSTPRNMAPSPLAPTQAIVRKSLGDQFAHLPDLHPPHNAPWTDPTHDTEGVPPPHPQNPASRIILDAFAGSGSVGIEWLSRGADRAVFIEQDPTLNQVLRENLKLLGLNTPPPTGNEVIEEDFFQYLKKRFLATENIDPAAPPPRFTHVYLDPPYKLFDNDRLRLQTLLAVVGCGLLAPKAWVFVERKRPKPSKTSTDRATAGDYKQIGSARRQLKTLLPELFPAKPPSSPLTTPQEEATSPQETSPPTTPQEVASLTPPHPSENLSDQGHGNLSSNDIDFIIGKSASRMEEDVFHALLAKVSLHLRDQRHFGTTLLEKYQYE